MVDPVSADFSVRMQLIVDVLAQTLDRAVLFDDEELTPITHSRQLGELDDVRVHSVLQRETRAEVKAALFEFGIGSADSALWIPAFPQYNLMPRLCVPVRSASERFGYLWIIVPDGSLSEHGRQLAERAGADLRDVLDRRNAALRAEESAQQGLLMRLIAAEEPGQAAAVVAELQTRAMAEPHDVVQVFRFRPGAAAKVDPVDRSLALRLRLAATDRTRRWYTLAGSPTTILAVAGSAAGSATTAETVTQGARASYGARPPIGTSGAPLPITQAALGFRQSSLALTLAEIGAGSTQVADWSTLGSWRTLALLGKAYGPDRLHDLVHPGIVGLIEQRRDDLLRTLETYLANGGDVRRTSEELFLHRSTLYYRLEKLTEAVGGDLSDGETRFELMLSLRLARLAGLYHPDSTDV
ncbi:PucR family transcriptional regulator [Mycolicibacterium fortuitum]|uniref:Helix-turn-helix domain-containing protein n=1 Tax=Mycolicibacterium fortuitum TaxID=1766 RepID=A0AAE4VEU6_MYCFO|nr:PucR family transcriptional regulator [Mycolicibacterium fortuitum]MCV7138069.1 helix-turn-helix domain-containing protein [Mycolicibacterium fortuitum]MDV7190140.1 helix-turn-helix domain-containing protein [Mycolicibacterium fortuitum]MDV7207306.1 helix-turn-helix domain-containing protein [Mycolicibacterium fortuitum]MDV7228911.1 helix-turn-helix domain-containing protein [Mycolicibacterium fortuitum]MDV7260762.1 helix-turn-helix domain-containing protein [Mycolicibacterium fortuitum]